MRLVYAAALLAPAAAAQPIATDRPDFTESTEVVPLSSVQLEAGVSSEWSDGTTSTSGPEVLLRWAPLRRMELRLEVPDYSSAVGGGFGDAAAGAKVQIGPVGGFGLAAIGMVTVPIGDSSHSADGLDPSLVITAAHDLLAGVGMGLQGGATWVSAEDNVDLALTLVAGADLTDRIGSFVELAADDLAGDPALVLHHGYTLALSTDAQVDVHAGVGLAGTAPDAFVGFGFAIRR